MVKRDQLRRYLTGFYNVGDFEDYCVNGLQVEGKEKIEKIVFGVSFNVPFLEQAIKAKADALIVHHGIFEAGNFKLTGFLKNKVKMLLDNDISLFGMHLPMDGHPEFGHNSLLLQAIGAEEILPFELGFCGLNAKGYTLDQMADIFHQQLHPESFQPPADEKVNEMFNMSRKHGFTLLANGPQVPKKVGVITGGSSSYYDKAIRKNLDTYFAGDIKEKTPAQSLETQTNFVNLGHYFSEKPGVLAIMERLKNKFKIDVEYIEVANPI